jgi:hypothetical protein
MRDMVRLSDRKRFALVLPMSLAAVAYEVIGLYRESGSVVMLALFSLIAGLAAWGLIRPLPDPPRSGG